MKHILLILISFLLLSSPVIGNSHKGETLYRWGESGNYKWMKLGDKETHSVYQGQVKDGKPNGLGVIFDPNGSKYVGSWMNGEQNGQGTETFPNGEKYVGEYKDGKPNGQGTFNSGGSKYVGEYKDGLPNGQGTHTFVKGDFVGEKYVGEYKDGKPNGQGTFTWSSGSKYVGEYKDGKTWNGTQYDKNGNITTKVVNGKTIKQ